MLTLFKQFYGGYAATRSNRQKKTACVDQICDWVVTWPWFEEIDNTVCMQESDYTYNIHGPWSGDQSYIGQNKIFLPRSWTCRDSTCCAIRSFQSSWTRGQETFSRHFIKQVSLAQHDRHLLFKGRWMHFSHRIGHESSTYKAIISVTSRQTTQIPGNTWSRSSSQIQIG